MLTLDPFGDDSKSSQLLLQWVLASISKHWPSWRDFSETEKLLWETTDVALTRIQALTTLDWVYNADE